MKYIVVLGDGMADEPLAELGGKTPLSVADTPNMVKIAPLSEIGMVKTIPDGMSPGSDTANLSVLGYDPKQYYTGRSPLEALSIGVDMLADDVAIRTNIVTLEESDKPYEELKIIDHSSGEITTEEAEVLLNYLKEQFAEQLSEEEKAQFAYYKGVSYRHLLIWSKGKVVELTPPHDILGRVVGEYLPENPYLKHMMKLSYEILKNHPINLKRKAEGKNPANSIWFWGAGTRPCLDDFTEKFNIKGSMISAVDLLKGIAVGANMNNIDVEGATGTLDTNYEGKSEAAIKELLENQSDFVYIHVEASDEMGHQGSIEKKITAIEYLDKRIIGPVKEALDKAGIDYRMLVLPDHPTPICIRTHSRTPVPYMLYDSTGTVHYTDFYDEAHAEETGVFIDEGYKLMNRLLIK